MRGEGQRGGGNMQVGPSIAPQLPFPLLVLSTTHLCHGSVVVVSTQLLSHVPLPSCALTITASAALPSLPPCFLHHFHPSSSTSAIDGSL